MQEGSLFSTSSLVFIVCIYLHDSYFDPFEVTLHYSLICISLIISNVESFHVLFKQSTCVLWRNAYLNLSPIFFPLGLLLLLLLKCMSFCIFQRLIFFGSFENVFSHTESCHFVLFMMFFAVQIFFFTLIRSHLFSFIFIFITLGGRSKKILL